MISSIIGFLIILGPLVIFHEFGHYIFARIFNVKAEIFSFGFGPRLFGRKWGETEFRLSAVPLGGYVKLLGEDPEQALPPEERKRSLHAQDAWKRFFIFFGGPFFNFVLAVLVYMAVLVIGEEQYSSVLARVIPGSEAARAGLLSGDKIVSIGNKPARLFSEVAEAIHAHPKDTLTFTVQRGSQPSTTPTENQIQSTLELRVTPSVEDGFSMYGEAKEVGKLDGISPLARGPVAGVSNPASEAAKAGIKTGDQVVLYQSRKVTSWEWLDAVYRQLASGAEFTLGFETADKKQFSVTWKKPEISGGDLGSDFGLYSSEMFVDQAVGGTPAEKAGIKSGDRIVKIDNIVLSSFDGLKDEIQRSARTDGEVSVSVERDGNIVAFKIKPTATQERDPVLKKIINFTIGVIPKLSFAEPDIEIERVWNPVTLVFRSFEKVWDFTSRNVVAIWKMLTGTVSVSTLGGPILIGKIAGDSLERGLIAFLNTMAILSISLGILNILPIPVLDGGHLLLLGIEAIRRKPLSIRQMEIVQQVGLSLIILLMVIVIRNDFARLPIFN